MGQQSAWDDITAAIANAPYPVRILPADPTGAQPCLEELGISTRSWLGAVVANAGALIVDHGWLRVLGCGAAGLPDVVAASGRQAGRLIVGFDVLGGQFVWIAPQPRSSPTVHYFGPDDLEWLDLEQGYTDWLHAMLSGSTTSFYEALRWPGWEHEVTAAAPDQGIVTYPPPRSAEGKDLVSAAVKTGSGSGPLFVVKTDPAAWCPLCSVVGRALVVIFVCSCPTSLASWSSRSNGPLLACGYGHDRGLGRRVVMPVARRPGESTAGTSADSLTRPWPGSLSRSSCRSAGSSAT
jgi:hypothetical protein